MIMNMKSNNMIGSVVAIANLASPAKAPVNSKEEREVPSSMISPKKHFSCNKIIKIKEQRKPMIKMILAPTDKTHQERTTPHESATTQRLIQLL